MTNPNLGTSTTDGQKHNSTMVSDALPGTAAPKMNKSFAHPHCPIGIALTTIA
jgi:hypothetical protein